MCPAPGRGTLEPSRDGPAGSGMGGNEKGNPCGKQRAAIRDHEGPDRKFSGVGKGRPGKGKTVSPPRLTLTLERQPRSGAEWRRVRRPAASVRRGRDAGLSSGSNSRWHLRTEGRDVWEMKSKRCRGSESRGAVCPAVESPAAAGNDPAGGVGLRVDSSGPGGAGGVVLTPEAGQSMHGAGGKRCHKLASLFS